jgi:hypothetical protein
MIKLESPSRLLVSSPERKGLSPLLAGRFFTIEYTLDRLT